MITRDEAAAIVLRRWRSERPDAEVGKVLTDGEVYLVKDADPDIEPGGTFVSAATGEIVPLVLPHHPDYVRRKLVEV